MKDKTDFLLEIGTEEIPAGYILKALEGLKDGLKDLFERYSLFHGKIRTLGTPRRLVVHCSDISLRQEDEEKEITGPPKAVAFNEDGSPTKAAEGFAKKNKVSINEITFKSTSRGEYCVIKKVIKGRHTKEILSEKLPEIISRLPFPKTMRWGSEEVTLARPVRWLLAILGNDVVPFSFGSVNSGKITFGHRFMSNAPVELESASLDLYKSKLKDAYCIVDIRARKQKVIEEAEMAANEVSGKVLDDKELIELNTFLTEYPSAICGSFSQDFLSLPSPVLITCMKEHQKYFAVVDEAKNLLPNFIAINNTSSPRPELVRKGHERVLGARLADADFFFKEDTKKDLEEFVQELSGMVFHKGLGTLLDKTKRLQSLSEYLSGCLLFKDLKTVKRAAYLCKADLCTEMVGEFPTLQGIMGKEYALISGEPREVATAIYEHYLPVRAGDKLPETIPGIILSLSDKIDNIVSAFAIGLKPSGTQDPFALRRQAIGIINILIERQIHLSLKNLIQENLNLLAPFLSEIPKEIINDLLSFFKARFKNELISRGHEYDSIDAAMAASFDSIYDCYQRVLALSSVRKQPEFEPISIAFKRVMNILKEFKGGEVKPELFDMSEEGELYFAFLQVKEQISPLLSTSDPTKCPDAANYASALHILLSLKPKIDAFFDNVMVMVEDKSIRDNRLALLWMIARLFLKIGNLSYIVTEKSDNGP